MLLDVRLAAEGGTVDDHLLRHCLFPFLSRPGWVVGTDVDPSGHRAAAIAASRPNGLSPRGRIDLALV